MFPSNPLNTFFELLFRTMLYHRLVENCGTSLQEGTAPSSPSTQKNETCPTTCTHEARFMTPLSMATCFFRIFTVTCQTKFWEIGYCWGVRHGACCKGGLNPYVDQGASCACQMYARLTGGRDPLLLLHASVLAHGFRSVQNCRENKIKLFPSTRIPGVSDLGDPYPH